MLCSAILTAYLFLGYQKSVLPSCAGSISWSTILQLRQEVCALSCTADGAVSQPELLEGQSKRLWHLWAEGLKNSIPGSSRGNMPLDYRGTGLQSQLRSAWGALCHAVLDGINASYQRKFIILHLCGGCRTFRCWWKNILSDWVWNDRTYLPCGDLFFFFL